ncbi:hypothetical protein KFK09_028626 [Dendrobium nobile]|uniref:Uncharacterized protein n=1 Tax=Dendrobium nobile TaxID=94219 RepID=A0A8T3A3L6_DENNO|nr:hypothetical protein KFK09_028626 [Dendrobium nobile]
MLNSLWFSCSLTKLQVVVRALCSVISCVPEFLWSSRGGAINRKATRKEKGKRFGKGGIGKESLLD